MNRFALITATVGLLAGAGCAWAQKEKDKGASAPGGIYTCVDDKGRRLTSDRPILECTHKEQRVLNKDGSLKAVRPPTLTADERVEQEAKARAAADAKAAQADAVRRDRNLMARYPNQAAHDRARVAALDTIRLAIRATSLRLEALSLDRKPLLDEAEFYKGKALPGELKISLDANDAATAAQRSAMQGQEAELARINKLYDAELAHLKQLWAGAQPGTLKAPAPAPAAASRPAR